MRMQYYDVNVYKFGNEYKVVYLHRFITDEPRTRLHKEPNMIGDRYSNNISRCKSTILGLALCNDWQYFVTFTLDKTKYDRFNLKAWKKDLSQWIRNQRRLYSYDIKYLLIPEMHKDGAWHIHGLFSGIPWQDLTRFEMDKHPINLCTSGYRYYEPMLNKFGFNSFGKLKNKAAASRYVLKYVGKGLGLQDIDSGCHLFYASQKLNRPELVHQGMTADYITDIDYQNDFMSSSWLSEKEINNVFENLR